MCVVHVWRCVYVHVHVMCRCSRGVNVVPENLCAISSEVYCPGTCTRAKLWHKSSVVVAHFMGCNMLTALCHIHLIPNEKTLKLGRGTAMPSVVTIT